MNPEIKNEHFKQPEYHQWLVDEAGGNGALLGLIVTRDYVMEKIVDQGGFHALDPDVELANKTTIAFMNSLILEEKRRLKLEPPAN